MPYQQRHNLHPSAPWETIAEDKLIKVFLHHPFLGWEPDEPDDARVEEHMAEIHAGKEVTFAGWTYRYVPEERKEEDAVPSPT